MESIQTAATVTIETNNKLLQERDRETLQAGLEPVSPPSICDFPYFKDIAKLQNHESSGIEQQRFTKMSISPT